MKKLVALLLIVPQIAYTAEAFQAIVPDLKRKRSALEEGETELPAELKRRVAYNFLQEELKACRWEPRAVPLFPHDYHVGAAAISPDGSRIAVFPRDWLNCQHHPYVIHEREGSCSRLNISPYSDFVRAASFNSTGSLIGLHFYRDYKVFPTTGAELIESLAVPGEACLGCRGGAFSADEPDVFAHCPIGEIALADIKKNVTMTVGKHHCIDIDCLHIDSLALMPGYQRLVAYNDKQGVLSIWDTTKSSGKPAKTIEIINKSGQAQYRDYNLSISPCGTYCALLRVDPKLHARDRITSSIEMYHAQTWERLYVFDAEYISSPLAFDRAGTSFAYLGASGNVKRHTSSNGELLQSHSTEAHYPCSYRTNFTQDLLTVIIRDQDGYPKIAHPLAQETLKDYFSKPRPHDQQLFVWLLLKYREFINNDATVKAARREKLGLASSAELKPINAILVDQFVEWLNGIKPDLMSIDKLRTISRGLPADVEKSLGLLCGLYVTRNESWS